MSTNTSQQLEQCLELIKPHTTDESKFAGLLLIPRILQPDDIPAIEAVFEAIDFKFLERLLRTTKQVPEETDAMNSIAVNILASFSISVNLINREEFIARIPTLMKTLISSQNLETRKEIARILFKLSEGSEGLELILNKYNFDYILRLYERPEGEENEEIQTLGLQLISFSIDQWNDFVYTQKVANDIQLKNTLIETLPFILETLGAQYHQRHDKVKFEIMSTLIRLLEEIPQEFTKAIGRSTTSFYSWTGSISSGTKDVLSHKHASKPKEDGLKLVALMLHHFGWDWLFSVSEHDKIKKEEKEKFAALVVELACIEINVRLDELSQESVSLEDLESKQSATIIDSYEILEKVISFLSTYMQDQEDEGTSNRTPIFSNESLLKLHNSLKSTFSVILEFILLKQVSFHCTLRLASPSVQLCTNVNLRLIFPQ
ncbi:hypothetical protein K7432_015843 [Basidiobolus ranarum]|uniref:Neurochondrin-domain-containing protein n=1 Tax=Basidiobolus ranarum TaxID=34480 RepID=A0ABR2VMH8_9FUNG